jgi:hypothetical protein
LTRGAATGDRSDVIEHDNRDEGEAELATLRRDLEQARQAWHCEQRRAVTAENRLRALPPAGARDEVTTEASVATGDAAPGRPASLSKGGFGERLDRLLRVAEAEAEQVRRAAADEAESLLGRAHEEAQTRRHAQQQSLNAAKAEADRLAERRELALDERERRLEERIAETERDLEAVLDDAQRRAEADRARVESEISARRNEAETEIARLRGLRESAYGELERLMRAVGEQLRAEPAAERAPIDLSGPVQAAGAG